MRVLTGDVSEMRWCVSNRADPLAARLADRHYSRQKVGSRQFVPPGSCCVFITDCAKAYWVTSAPKAEYVKHAWAGAWICSAFRSEGAGCASDLIRQAVAATKAHYKADPPALGMVTFIDTSCRKCKKNFPKCGCVNPEWVVKPTMRRGKTTWGYTYKKAGFIDVGRTKGGLLALQLRPDDMPAPMPAKVRLINQAKAFRFT